MKSWRQYLELFLSGWIRIVERFNILIILFFIAGVAVSLHYTLNHLGMNTSTRDMLSPDLSWRILDQEYADNFPQYTNNILVVIESATPDQAIDAANLLYNHLQTETTLFKSVYYPPGLPFFKESALLYLDIDELQDLSDNLAAIQPFLARLTEDQSIRGLFNMLSEALEAKLDGENIDLTTLLERINETFIAVHNKQRYQLSWHSLMNGEDESKSIHREFIVLQPILNFDNFFPAQAAIDKIHSLADELKLTPENNIRLRLTGSAVLSHEELKNVTSGTWISVIFSFGMVLAVLLAGLRSIWLVLTTYITLIAGLIFTAWFAAFTVGELNLISITFAVLYIGLGADFAIHFCLHYRESLQRNKNNEIALRNTAINVGESLVLCTAATAIGFYAFMPTDYSGVAELGWISGTGIVISLIVTLTLLPALLSLFPLREQIESPVNAASVIYKKIINVPIAHAGKIKVIAVILTVASLIALSKLTFDYNTLNLQSPKNESVQTYLDLLANDDTSPWTSNVLATGVNEAKRLDQQLTRLNLVNKVVWLEDFIPADQDEKLSIIEEMNLLLGTLPVATETPPLEDKERILAIQKFNRILQSALESDQTLAYAQPLHQNIDGFLDTLERSDQQAQHELLHTLETSLLASFKGRLEALLAALNADTVSQETLPDELKTRWLNQNNKYLLEIYPTENLMDNQALRRFVNQVQAVVPRVTGGPVIIIEAGDAVVKAFIQAFSYALIAIILLLLLMHNVRDTVYILIPLLLAALFTGAISVCMHIPLNFANIIALPLILGMGIDSAIHIMHRVHNALPEDDHLLDTSSARAVVLTALTTIFSVFSLVFSPHLGTASMGILLTVGISMTMICSIIVLPGLLVKQSNQVQN